MRQVLAAVDYLMYSGYVTLAYFWARMAAVSQDRKSQEADGDVSFYEAKMMTARFYFERLLPRTQSLKYDHAVRRGQPDADLPEATVSAVVPDCCSGHCPNRRDFPPLQGRIHARQILWAGPVFYEHRHYERRQSRIAATATAFIRMIRPEGGRVRQAAVSTRWSASLSGPCACC